jgi:ribonuclease HI
MTPSVKIITDGSALSTGSVGGWAAILQYDVNGVMIEKELSGRIDLATNQRAELQAVIEGLKALKQSCAVELISDSEYVVKGSNYWLARWVYKGWCTKGHKPVANLDLWKQIYELKQLHQVKATWVKGHSSNPWNNRCDELANQARLSVV